MSVIVTTLQTAQVMTWTLWYEFFTHYRFHPSMLSDQGHTFESSLIKELCDLGCIHKIHIPPYHLQGNGQCTWFNFTLISMIGTLQGEDKSHWRDVVPTLVHAYNCTKSNAMELLLNVWAETKARP